MLILNLGRPLCNSKPKPSLAAVAIVVINMLAAVTVIPRISLKINAVQEAQRRPQSRAAVASHKGRASWRLRYSFAQNK